MKRAWLAAVVALAPAIAWAQEPQSPPIVSEPLPPPKGQVPPTQPGPGQSQSVQPLGGGRGSPGLTPPPVQAPPPPGQGGSVPPSPQAPSATQTMPAPGAFQPSQSPPTATPPEQSPQQSGQPASPAGSPAGLPATPGQSPAVPGPPAGPTPAPPPPNVWVPQGGAILQVLDKVNATTTTLNVRVGQSATYGSLRIQVLACEIRPPDMPQDAAASLVINDTNPDQPGFQGWMLQNEPFLSMLQSPSYDVRVEGCTP
jgi:Uncharacterized protein conserved in bacteria (DUF2155)